MPSHRSSAPPLLVLAWLGVAALLGLGAGAVPQPSSSCRRECGGVDIPYLFGILDDDGDCAMPGFGLTCKDTGINNGGRKPFSGNVEVVGVSMQRGQARMLMSISTYCYNADHRRMEEVPWQVNFTGTPYRFADTNKFTVIGCQTLAYIKGDDKFKYMSGCVAMCRRGGGDGDGDVSSALSLTDGSCSGIGCCQAAIPKGLQYYRVSFDPGFTTAEIHDVSRCSYAVLMDPSDFVFQTTYATSPGFNSSYDGGKAPLLMDWAVGNQRCDEARRNPSSYACVSDHSECIDSLNGPGYFCNCSKGYHGNPYLKDREQGCKGTNSIKNVGKPGSSSFTTRSKLLGRPVRRRRRCPSSFPLL